MFKGCADRRGDKVECVTRSNAKGQIFRSGLSRLIWLPLMDSNHRCLSQSQVPYRLAKGQCNV